MFDISSSHSAGGSETAWPAAEPEEITKDVLIALVLAKSLSTPGSRPLLKGFPLLVLPRLISVKTGLDSLFPEFVI